MNFCFIYNKNSANGRQSKYVNKIYKEIQKSFPIDFFETKSEEEAAIILRDFNKKKYNRLILAGGDGTVSFAINQLIKQNNQFLETLSIGYVPTGTTNVLKVELNINNKINKIVKTLTSNNIKRINPVKINDDYFLLMSSFGWDAEIIDSIKPSTKKKLGKFIFLIKMIKNFIFMKNKKFIVTIDKSKYFTNWALCCNSIYYAGNYKIRNGSLFENKFTTVIFKDFSRLKFLHLLFIIICYKDISKAKYIIFKETNNISIEKIHENIPSQIDGSFFGKHKKITILSSDIYINVISN